MGTTIDLLPHRPPWLLVDRVVAQTETTVEAHKLLAADDPLLVRPTLELPDFLVLEALAQAAACLATEALGRHTGLLVAATHFHAQDRARTGEILRLVAEREAMLGRLHRFAGHAFVGERAIASGRLTFALQEEP